MIDYADDFTTIYSDNYVDVVHASRGRLRVFDPLHGDRVVLTVGAIKAIVEAHLANCGVRTDTDCRCNDNNSGIDL